MIPVFSIIRSDREDVSLLQGVLETIFKHYSDRPQNDSFLLENIALETGYTNKVFHKLQREPRGWAVVRKNAECDIWEITGTTDSNVLALATSANVTVSLQVF